MTAFLSDGVLNLRPVNRDDLAQLAEWRNTPEIRQRTREWKPLNDADQERWFQRISGPDRRDLMFVVEAAGSRERIGVVGLCYWDPLDATAEVSFYIGEPSARGQGFAPRALTLLLDWGFETMRLERIWAEAYAFNDVSIGLLQSLGFTEEGRLRSHVFRQGKRWDSVMLGLLREEWRPR
jgi:RimJ/RimL family protein N-acetyltransferase